MATPTFSKKLATSTGIADPPTKDESRQPPNGACYILYFNVMVRGVVWVVSETCETPNVHSLLSYTTHALAQ